MIGKKLSVLLGAVLTAGVFASDNLDYGVPGKADQIVERSGYALGFCNAWKEARWVSYRLTQDEVEKTVVKKSNDFQVDPVIRAGSATLEDYLDCGFDRGHLAPAADMKWSAEAMNDCFYMSNICPQNHGCNGGIWSDIEITVRGFARTEKSIFIVTGPVVGKAPRTVGINRVAVPSGFYKVIFDETAPQKMIAFYVPNADVPGKPVDFVCTVDQIETLTGLNFFSKLPTKTQTELEHRVDVNAWDWEAGPPGDIRAKQAGQKRSAKRTKSGQKAHQARQGGTQKQAVRNAQSASATAPSAAADDVKLPAFRKEYFAGRELPVGNRKAAPVCDDWPDTGYWLSTNSDKRHNRGCENYRKTRGYPCRKNEGEPCGKCGG